MLTEQEITRNWRSLFRNAKLSEEIFVRAESLLDELRRKVHYGIDWRAN